MKIVIKNIPFAFDLGCKLLKTIHNECPFDELQDFWNDIQPLSFHDILKIENIEQRRVCFSTYGTEKLLEYLHLDKVSTKTIKRKNKWLVDNKLVDKSVNEIYELYRLRETDKTDLGLAMHNKYYILKFKDTSTDRVYLLWLANLRNEDAIEAIAFSFRTKVREGNIEKIIRQGDCMMIKIKDESIALLNWERPLTKDEYINLVINES